MKVELYVDGDTDMDGEVISRDVMITIKGRCLSSPRSIT